jgi:ribosomal protein S18 acetylase RimI-like enzyme
VSLQFVDRRRGDANRYRWVPFGSSDAYDHPHWWDDVRYHDDDPWFVQVLEVGVEVARVELDEDVGIEHYNDVPVIGAERLEIQFIEVAVSARGRGIGTRVVRGLMGRHPERRLLAYSEGADRFWASLGWDRFDHSDGRHRALFIRRAR